MNCKFQRGGGGGGGGGGRGGMRTAGCVRKTDMVSIYGLCVHSVHRNSGTGSSGYANAVKLSHDYVTKGRG